MVPREPHQLPPGPHGLTREQVRANQRQRMLDATVVVAAVAGYSAMSVEDVISTAGVSRRTFYEHFEDKDAVFEAAFDQVAGELRAQLTAADAPQADPARRGLLVLRAAVDFVVANPDRGEMLLVQASGASHGVVSARDRLLSQWTDAVRSVTETQLPSDALPAGLAADLVMGGIVEILYSRLLRGQTASLPGLVPAMLHSALVIYLGPDEAVAALERALAQDRA